MRSLLGFVLLVVNLGGVFTPHAVAQAKATRPKIVYIVADDLGWKDVGFHGSDIKTPTIDRLAESGARLESFYSQPLCTPSRAALMTGRYPLRYGLQTGVILSDQTYGLPTDEWLLPQALKEVGYTTAIVGKCTSAMPTANTGRGSGGLTTSTAPFSGRSTTSRTPSMESRTGTATTNWSRKKGM